MKTKVLQKKNGRNLNALSRKKSRGGIWIVILFLLIFAMLYMTKRETRITKTREHSPTQSKVSQNEMLERVKRHILQLQQTKNETLKQMRIAAAGMKQANDLADFFEKRSFLSVAIGPQETQRFELKGVNTGFMERANHPEAFELVFMDSRYSSYYPSSVLYMPNHNALRVMQRFALRRYFGIIMLHETQHVWDCRKKLERVRYAWDQRKEIENPRNPSENIEGEVRAYNMECELMRRWRPKKYAAMLENGTPILEKKFEQLEPYFPEAVPQNGYPEAGMMIASILVCMSFDIAKKSNRNLAEVYKEVRERYHERP